MKDVPEEPVLEAVALATGVLKEAEGTATELLEAALAADVLEPETAKDDDTVTGPGPPTLRLNRRINKRVPIVNGPTGNDLRALC